LDKKKILIATADFKKSYPVIKSVSRSGYKPIVVVHRKMSWPSFSKYVYKRFKVANPYLNEKKYALQIAKIAMDENVSMIIPVGFIDNLVLAKYQDFFRNIILPIPSYESIKRVSNKANLGEIFSKIGIKYPKTIIFDPADLEAINQLAFPLVSKGISDASTPFYLFNKHHLSRLLKENNNKNEKTILQQFIAGNGHGYFAIAKNGEVYLEFCHKRIIEARPSGGPSITACVYHDDELIKIGRKIIKEIEWTGVLMVEFKKDYETGEYFLIEINPKFWGSLELPISYGVDFVGALIKIFLEKKNKVKVFSKGKDYCFSWILAGSNYLINNYKIWLRIVRTGLKQGIFATDIHINDPPELFLSSSIALFKIFSEKKKIQKEKKMMLQKTKQFFIESVTQTDIKAIFFDFDGTITKLKIDWNKVHKKLLEKKLISPYDGVMVGVYKSLKNNTFKEIDEILRHYEIKASKNVFPDKTLIELLEKIKKQKIITAIVSKQAEEPLKIALNNMKLNKNFDLIIGREHGIKKSKQIKTALKLLKIPAENVLFIGDTLIDIVAAANNNITAYAISNNPYDVHKFLEFGIPCFSSIKELLKTIIEIKKWK